MTDFTNPNMNWYNWAWPSMQQQEPTCEPKMLAQPNGFGGYVVIKDGYKIHKFDSAMEGVAEHTFQDLDSFALYMNRHHGEMAATDVDILVQEGIVKAYVCPTDARVQKIRCELIKDPAWEAWDDVLNVPMGQREIQQFVRCWRSTLPNSDELMAAFSAIQVTGSQTMNSHIDETGATRLSSSEGTTNVAVRIPPILQADVPCFEGVSTDGVTLNTYSLEVFVEVMSDPLMFTLKCPTLEVHERQARRDVAKYLALKLSDDFLVGIGTGKHTQRGMQAEE